MDAPEREECLKEQEELEDDPLGRLMDWARSVARGTEYALVRNSPCLADGFAASAAVAGDILALMAIASGVATVNAVRASGAVIGAAWRAGVPGAADLVAAGNALVTQTASATAERAVFRGAAAGLQEIDGAAPSLGGFIRRAFTFQSPGRISAAAGSCR